jgi:hypothetical protein
MAPWTHSANSLSDLSMSLFVSLLAKTNSTFCLKHFPEPCPEFGMDEASLAQLKAATTSTSSSKIAKKIRVFNTAVKQANNSPPTPPVAVSPNGMLGTPGSRSPASEIAATSSSPSGDVFDDADEESLIPAPNTKNKKRKSPTSDDVNVNHTDLVLESFLSPSSKGEPPKKRLKNWIDPIDIDELDTSEAHIKELVEKHRKLKRMTDVELAKSPHDLALLDNYFKASLGFFEAAALYELNAKTHMADSENWRRSISLAIDLYKGLVPTSEKPSLLTYYVSRCDQSKLKLRIVLGQRCLSMAYARLWRIQHKTLYSSFSSLLKGSPHRDTLEVKTTQLAELLDICKFGDYYERSESEARLHQSVFSPFPSHPIDLDPFQFLEFIREEHQQVALVERSNNEGPGANIHSSDIKKASSSSSTTKRR